MRRLVGINYGCCVSIILAVIAAFAIINGFGWFLSLI